MLIERVITEIEKRRENILNGGINSIPSPFERFKTDFVGIEQGQYVVITAPTKVGKTQLASYLYVYTPLLYAFDNPEKCSVDILYFPFEETPERIIQRFMSFLLNYLSDGKIVISPKDLRSTDNTRVIPEEILSLLKSERYGKYLKYFEDHVHFFTDDFNPTGIYKKCRDYALSIGKVINKTVVYGDGQEHEVFDRYEPNDKNHYVILLVDHCGLVEEERGMTLKQSIDKLSEYMLRYLRNRYGFTCVNIQQQSFENEGIEAQRYGKIETSIAGLSDSKYTSRDGDMVLGLFSPYKFSLPNYKGYDITKFRNNIRFMSVLTNRDGNLGGVCPLYFDGATCMFKELPLPEDKENLKKVYEYIDKRKASKSKITGTLFFKSSKIKSDINNLKNGKLCNNLRKKWNGEIHLHKRSKP